MTTNALKGGMIWKHYCKVHTILILYIQQYSTENELWQVKNVYISLRAIMRDRDSERQKEQTNQGNTTQETDGKNWKQPGRR